MRFRKTGHSKNQTQRNRRHEKKSVKFETILIDFIIIQLRALDYVDFMLFGYTK